MQNIQSQESDYLISAQEVSNLIKEKKNNKNLTIIECTFKLGKPAEDWDIEYKQNRIPGARFFHSLLIADLTQKAPSMLPSTKEWVEFMKDLDIGINDTIITYARGEMYGSTRVWYALKAYGCKNVHVLQGGFEAYQAQGYSIEETELLSWKNEKRERGNDDFAYIFKNDEYITMAEVRNLVDANEFNNSKIQYIDVRDNERFKQGHVPGAKNVFFKQFLDEQGKLKSKEAIEQQILDQKIDMQKPTIIQCGSGISATILFISLKMAGHKELKLYDGSWKEYSLYKENDIQDDPEDQESKQNDYDIYDEYQPSDKKSSSCFRCQNINIDAFKQQELKIDMLTSENDALKKRVEFNEKLLITIFQSEKSLQRRNTENNTAFQQLSQLQEQAQNSYTNTFENRNGNVRNNSRNSINNTNSSNNNHVNHCNNAKNINDTANSTNIEYPLDTYKHLY